MKRKVVRQANQAYTITLPINWVRENKIDKNKEVDLEVSEKNILIYTKNTSVGEKIEINADNLEESQIYRILGALYARGADEITFVSKKNLSSQISKYTNSTLGFALVEQKQDKYLIKDLRQGEYENIDEIFKRVFQMLMIYYDSLIKDVFEEKKEDLESLEARDIEVNKFCLYLQRGINKSSYQNQKQGRALFTYSYEIEKIGDEIQRAWRTAIKYKPKLSKETLELANLSKEGLEKAFEFYYQFNINKIKEIYSLRDKVREKSLKIKSSDAHATRFVRHIVKIIEDASDLTHLTLMIKL
ncbi:MAG: hypothetical protein ACP5OG_06215 [Candidatus Nanoarchaeia archaeon]